MGSLRGSEWLILALVVILLFGAKKLPDAARGLGRSLRIFKSEIKQPDTVDEVDVHGSTAVTPATAAIVQAPVQAVPAPAPAYVPVQAAPLPTAPVVQPVPTVDETSVQSVNERFYGQETSDR